MKRTVLVGKNGIQAGRLPPTTSVSFRSSGSQNTTTTMTTIARKDPQDSYVPTGATPAPRDEATRAPDGTSIDCNVRGHRAFGDLFVRRAIPRMDRISGTGEPKGGFVERHRHHRVCQREWPAAPPIAINIAAAIERLIADSQEESGPEIEFYEDVPIDELPSKLQAVVFFIVRELLFNACRHSHSKRLFVELTLDGNVLHIRVRDWGVGFDPDSTPSGHFGLNGIRRRVKLLGGKAIRRGGLTMMDYISGIFWELAKWLAGKTKYTKKSKRP